MRNIELILCLTITAALCGTASAAMSVDISRTLTYTGHTRSYQISYDTTFFTDTYTFNADPIFLASDTYDASSLTLDVGSGLRLMVDDAVSPVTMFIDAQWVREFVSDTIPTTPYTVSYTNGAGDLPGPDPPASFGLSSGGSFIRFREQFSDVNGAFAFDAVTLASTFSERGGGGTYAMNQNIVTFRYAVSGDAPEAGRFTHLVVPEPTSAALLALGGVASLRRRRLTVRQSRPLTARTEAPLCAQTCR